MAKYFFLILLITLCIFTVVVSIQPSDFHVVRTKVIEAKPAAVFAQVNNLKNWEKWSPWAELDPQAKYEFKGPESGVGAEIIWAGNGDIGQGTMKITESQTNEKVQFQISFQQPMESVSTSEILLKPEGKGTKATWVMHGTNGFLGKAMGLIFNCEKMVGDQFEKGLSNLNALLKAKK